MKILIANDDGPKAEGLQVLRAAAKAAYPHATIVTITPRQPSGGQGLSVTPRNLRDLPVERMDSQWYVCDAKPADIIYLALGQPRRFLARGRFDLVLTGVNHGENIGMDVFHSGTVGMAMLASTFFGTAAVALSSQGKQDATSEQVAAPSFDHSKSSFIVNFLRSDWRKFSLCWNVNFPGCRPLGWKVCSVAYHSRFRPFKAEERKHDGCDVVQLEKGLIAISPLCLNVAPWNHFTTVPVDPVHWACRTNGTCFVGSRLARETTGRNMRCDPDVDKGGL